MLSPLFSAKLDRLRLKFHQAYPGRGGDLVPSPVKRTATELGLTVVTLLTLALAPTGASVKVCSSV